MTRRSRIARSLLAIVSLFCIFMYATACSSTASSSDVLYVFNTKSEINAGLKTLVEEYGKETDTPVKIFSPGSGSDVTETFNTEMTSSTPPAIFSTNGLVTWGPKDGDFMLNLNETDNAELKALADEIPDELRLQTESDENLGIPYTVEGYGYILDTGVLKDLFNLDDVSQLVNDLKTCDYPSFRAFEDTVADYIDNPSAMTVNLNGHEYTTPSTKQGLAANLTGLFVESGAEKWTYADHMINIPLNAVFANYGDAYYSSLEDIEALASPAEKAMRVLEYNTSHAAGKEGPNTRGPAFVNTTTGSYDYALQLFASHKGLFIKQGSWIFPNLTSIFEENDTSDGKDPSMLSRLDIIPIKMPFTQSDITVDDRTPEAFNTSIPVMVPNYWIINKKASKAQQDAAAKFLVWLFTSEKGRNFLTNDAGFIVYDDLSPHSNPNTLNTALLQYLNEGKTLSNPFNAAPGNWLEFVGNQLKQRYMTSQTWDDSTYADYVQTIITRWKNLKDIASS